MQPYFLPYIGYFQLIVAVDVFVLYDDVTWIKQGWINRNRILINGEDHLFSLEVEGASSFKPINTINLGKNRMKLLKTFDLAYKKAPFYNHVMPLLSSIFNLQEQNLSNFIFHSIQTISNYLEINTKLLVSSQIKKSINLKGHDRIIDICKRLNANTYINATGGKSLYSKDIFSSEGIDLKFLETIFTRYNQNSCDFIPGLSIVDVLMFNSQQEVKEMLHQFKLV
jgi:hypothetical protein